MSKQLRVHSESGDKSISRGRVFALGVTSTALAVNTLFVSCWATRLDSLIEHAVVLLSVTLAIICIPVASALRRSQRRWGLSWLLLSFVCVVLPIPGVAPCVIVKAFAIVCMMCICKLLMVREAKDPKP